MASFKDFFPEIDVMRGGDPFVTAIVRYDERIDDLETELYGHEDAVTVAQFEAALATVRADRYAYECDVLARWLELRSPSVH